MGQGYQGKGLTGGMRRGSTKAQGDHKCQQQPQGWAESTRCDTAGSGLSRHPPGFWLPLWAPWAAWRVLAAVLTPRGRGAHVGCCLLGSGSHFPLPQVPPAPLLGSLASARPGRLALGEGSQPLLPALVSSFPGFGSGVEGEVPLFPSRPSAAGTSDSLPPGTRPELLPWTGGTWVSSLRPSFHLLRL